MGTHTGLIAHWPLAGDCRDHSGNGHHGRNRGADLTAGGAVLDGRGAHVLVPPSAGLDLGTGDFTLTVQIRTDAVLDDVPGDIVSRYAPGTRTGFQLSLLNNAGVTAAQANYRHLHFGIDAGSDCAWADCGRPGNNLRVYSLCVFRGDLYAGTFETGADEAGGVYRYDGEAGWEPCGSPDTANTVASLCVFNGDLYAGTSCYRAGGSALPESENRNPRRRSVPLRGRFGVGERRPHGRRRLVRRHGRLPGRALRHSALQPGRVPLPGGRPLGALRHARPPHDVARGLQRPPLRSGQRGRRVGRRVPLRRRQPLGAHRRPAGRLPGLLVCRPTTGGCTPAPGRRARSSATTATTRGPASAAWAKSWRSWPWPSTTASSMPALCRWARSIATTAATPGPSWDSSTPPPT